MAHRVIRGGLSLHVVGVGVQAVGVPVVVRVCGCFVPVLDDVVYREAVPTVAAGAFRAGVDVDDASFVFGAVFRSCLCGCGAEDGRGGDGCRDDECA